MVEGVPGGAAGDETWPGRRERASSSGRRAATPARAKLMITVRRPGITERSMRATRGSPRSSGAIMVTTAIATGARPRPGSVPSPH